MSGSSELPSNVAGGEGPSRRQYHPDDILDSCLEFLGVFVTKSLRVKYDKWQKLVTAEDSKVNRSLWEIFKKRIKGTVDKC